MNTVLIVLIIAVSLTIINVADNIADIFKAKYENSNKKIDNDEEENK